MEKKWWQSKTLWLNIIAVIIVLVQVGMQSAWIKPEYQVAILAILNAFVRLLTNQPIEGTVGAKINK